MINEDYVFEVEEDSHGLSLQQFLQKKLEGKYSNKKIKHWIDRHLCQVNHHVESFASAKLLQGDQVRLQLPIETPSLKQLSILFEDKYLIAINKPPDLVCEDHGLRNFFKDVFLIHRLDKDTSGVLLLAKSEKVKQAFIPLFRQQFVDKTYLAVTSRAPHKTSGILKSYFMAHQEGIHKRWRSQANPPGDYAETYWKCLQTQGSYSLVLCKPKTGRTHQLRVHLQELGCPILGDWLYSSSSKHVENITTRQLLHAWKIAFPHPYTRQPIEIIASIPKDFRQACAKLGLNHAFINC